MDLVASNEIDAVESDYYLFSFSDDELKELLSKSDEWSHFDVSLAKKILKDRGTEIKQEDFVLLKQQRVEELAKPEENMKLWIYIAYALSLLGGFLGILIGWHLLYHKKTLPDGQRVFGYSPLDRKHGFRIVILGVIFCAFWLTVRILA